MSPALGTYLVLLIVFFGSIFAIPVSGAINCTLNPTVVPVGTGTVTLTPSGGTYVCGTNVFFKATPNPGYYFVGWGLSDPLTTGPGDGHMWYYTWQNPANKSLDGNLRLLAYFQATNQWVRYSNSPVLGPSAGGWDSSSAPWQPRVFTYPNGSYGMVYLSEYAAGTRAIGLATSPDGRHWKKYSSSILQVSPGSWDSWGGGGQMAIAPGSVFWDGSKFVLYYSASNSTDTSFGKTGKPGFGLATSPDSITWTKQGEVFSNGTDYNQRASQDCGNKGSLHSQAYFRFPDVVKVGGTYYMWYSRAFAVRLATSNDGVNWTVQNGGCAVLFPADWNDPNPPPNQARVHGYAWDGDWVSYPSAFYDPVAKNFKMFYSGWDYDGVIQHTGFATSQEGITWTKYVGNSILSPMPGGWDNGDMTHYSAALLVNGTINVYYSSDTLSSLMCREGYDPSCVNYDGYLITGIGLATVAEVPLSVGWNLVSPPLVPNNNDIKSILAPQLSAGEVTIVWSYAGKPRAWQFFQPPALGTLKTMQDGNGYWIKMTTADTLLVGGNVIPPASSPPSYQLLAGWNLVGFKPQPTLQNETVGQFLISLGSSYDSNHVYVYDSYAGSWTKATGGTWLVPGQALWVYVTAVAGTTLTP